MQRARSAIIRSLRRFVALHLRFLDFPSRKYILRKRKEIRKAGQTTVRAHLVHVIKV